MTCTKCGASKPEDRFKWCDTCREYQREASRRWAAKHRQPKPPRPKMTDDERRARRRDWYARNADRERQRSARWQAENYQRWREINTAARARWQRRNLRQHAMNQAIRRALKSSATISNFTLEQLQQRLSMYAGCWICGTPNWDHVDHVKPLSRGGPHILANLRPACASCNTRKGATWPLP